jgi:hypothetical protein
MVTVLVLKHGGLIWEILQFLNVIEYNTVVWIQTDDGYWMIKTNQAINDVLKGQNIIGFIKKQRLI